MRADKKIKLKIGYKEYGLYFVKEIDGGAAYGECVNGDKAIGTIRIAKGQKRVEKANTVLHEVLHAIAYVQGMHLEDKLEERVVRAFTNGLIDLMRENPGFIKKLTEMVKK